jgi:hypothetical protein
MPDERIAEFAGEVEGIIRGRSVRGPATIRVGERGLAIVLAGGELRLPYGRLDGWSLQEGTTALHVSGGDVIAVRLPWGTSELDRALTAHAFALPELTRGLRSLGSARAHADPAQAELFAPLLAGRRRAARVRDPAGRVRALDAELLRRELDTALRTISAKRIRQPGPERRALDAALDEAAAPLLASVAALEEAAERFGRAPGSGRLIAWRAWTEAVRAVFAAADACWPAIWKAIEEAPAPPSRWRRWTHLGAVLVTLCALQLGRSLPSGESSVGTHDRGASRQASANFFVPRSSE